MKVLRMCFLNGEMFLVIIRTTSNDREIFRATMKSCERNSTKSDYLWRRWLKLHFMLDVSVNEITQ